MMELKPCPGCGDEYLMVYVDRLTESSIRCSNCGFRYVIDNRHCSDSTTGQNLEELIKGWNRRATEDRADCE